MKASEYLLKALVVEGITHVFLVPGGLIDSFLPALADEGGIAPIVAAQEGGAVYMADGYARAGGRFGVCFCIGGPGITNTVTPLGAAFTDHSPVLVVSGEVPTNWEGRGAFQDASAAGLNDVEILRPVTSMELVAEDVHLLKPHLRRLLAKMQAEPKSPVHLSIPKNIQNAQVSSGYHKIPPEIYMPQYIDHHATGRFWGLVEDCARIAILAGAGVETAQATPALIRFAERYEIPVATTLRAKGVFPEDHHLSLGVFGYGGTRHAIETITSDQVEALLVLGSGLSQRDTLFWTTRFHPSRALIQVDINPSIIGQVYPVDLAVAGDCGAFLEILNQAEGTAEPKLLGSNPTRRKWLAEIRASGDRCYDPEAEQSNSEPIHPARAICELRNALPRDTVLFVDSGAHRAFAGHYWQSCGPRQYLSATNLGPMGWAIPASIGGKLARPDAPCAAVTGDGCMLMHGIEIQTAARYDVNVIFVVINNSALANVYLRAKAYGAGAAELTELPTHDWAAFAESLGVKGIAIHEPQELAPGFRSALAHGGAVLLDVRCGKDYPTPVTPYSHAKQEWMDSD